MHAKDENHEYMLDRIEELLERVNKLEVELAESKSDLKNWCETIERKFDAFKLQCLLGDVN